MKATTATRTFVRDVTNTVEAAHSLSLMVRVETCGKDKDVSAIYNGLHAGVFATEIQAEAHLHERATKEIERKSRRALSTATLTDAQADVIAEDLAPAADLAHDVAQAASEGGPIADELATAREAGYDIRESESCWQVTYQGRVIAELSSRGYAITFILENVELDRIVKPDAPTASGGVVADEYKIVTIPALAEHGGSPFNLRSVTLRWICPVCGGPRGEVERVISWDGSRRLGCDGWQNPCGHVDNYTACREEAARTPVPFDYDQEMQAAATALLHDEERRAGVPEAQPSVTPVSDLYGARIDALDAQLDRLFPTEGEVNARAGRDELYPRRDAVLDIDEALLYIQSAVRHLEAADGPGVMATMRRVQVAAMGLRKAIEPLRTAAEAEDQAYERLADQAA